MKTLKLLLLLLTLNLGAQPLEYKDVASVFYARCTSCHNQYSHGPSFLNYSSILPNINNIEANLLSGRMPPWTPDTNYTRFVHENRISLSEKNAILNWISFGAVKGDTTLAPAAPVYGRYKLNGQPDLELKIPPFNSNASTNDSYVCFSLPMGLTQDRVLRAYEIIAGNSHIVHHVVVNIDTTGSTSHDLSGNCFDITGDYSIGGFAPGTPPTVFPASAALKMGIRIKSGSKLVMQIHYPAGSIGMPDSTKIRMYFYPVNESNVRPVYVTTPLQNWSIVVPASSTRTFTAVYPQSAGLPYNISLFAAFPHSHKAATTIINYAFKTTDTVPLIRINKWDFDQQGYYTFKKMPKIPSGYKLFSKHVYANSGGSPIFAGTNTTDEMLFDSFQWMMYQPGDENIDVNSLLKNDPLLNQPTTVNESHSGAGLISSYAFPNPFNRSISIGYTFPRSSHVRVEILSVTGIRVRTLFEGFEQAGHYEKKWDGMNDNGEKISAGAYFYTVTIGALSSHGKIITINN